MLLNVISDGVGRGIIGSVLRWKCGPSTGNMSWI